jgi:hypothetical protein
MPTAARGPESGGNILENFGDREMPMIANPKIRNAWSRKRGLNEISGIAQMQRLCRGNATAVSIRQGRYLAVWGTCPALWA